MPRQAVGWTLTVVCAAGQHPLLRGDLCELKEEKASGTSEVEVVEKNKNLWCVKIRWKGPAFVQKADGILLSAVTVFSYGYFP